MTTTVPPIPLRRGRSCAICDFSSRPTMSAAPTHSAAPAALNAANRPKRMRVAPASGGAIIDRPGTNLAMTSARGPQRSKLACVWLTQVSGVSEMRHRSFITRAPYLRPARYQLLSPMRQAATARANTADAGSRPFAARAPATTSVGTAGRGRPSCSSSTLRKIRLSPKGSRTCRSCPVRGTANSAAGRERAPYPARLSRCTDTW